MGSGLASWQEMGIICSDTAHHAWYDNVRIPGSWELKFPKVRIDSAISGASLHTANTEQSGAQQVLLQAPGPIHQHSAPSRLAASRASGSRLGRHRIRRCGCCCSCGAAAFGTGPDDICGVALALGGAATNIGWVREVFGGIWEVELEEGGRVIGQGSRCDYRQVAHDMS